MNAAAVRSSAVANPWFWVATGFLVSLLTPFLSLAGSTFALPVAFLVVLGLGLVGIGLTIRFSSEGPSWSVPFPKSLGILILAVFQLIGLLFVTWCLIAAIVGVDPLWPSSTDAEHPPALRLGLGIILWLLVAPMTFKGLRTTLGLPKDGSWTTELETSFLCMVGSAATLAAGFALSAYQSSLVLPLGALTGLLATLVPFWQVSQSFRRWIVSAAITLHFTAIISATLAAHPSSWLLAQIWTRFSRPYLEFMYLNNAYHFYSPDPGPASYLWFRVFFDTKTVDPDTGEKKLVAKWVKIPDVKDDGNHGYRVALEYQRYLSLTEQVISSEPPPQLYFRGADGKMTPTPMFASRIFNSPDGEILKREWKGEVIGQDKIEMPAFVLSVPFHPFVQPNDMQYQKPTIASRRMLETYVRHVAKTTKLPTRDWPIHSIKVYRVKHTILPWNVYAAGMEPTDPEFYQPYYMGEYKPNGEYMTPEEPLRYWLLPILRENTSLPNSPIRNYAAMHAGDPNSVYSPTQKKWVEAPKEGK